MKMKLDQIEARLQALIESSSAIFANSDAHHKLAHQLVQAAQENLVSSPDGQTLAPGVFTIYLHPDNLLYWQERGDLLDATASNLQQAAREYGLVFTRRPLFRLIPDPSLSMDEYHILADEQQDPSGGTAAFAAVPTQPQVSRIPINAFLIVEGNHIFPLNRSVINIGRRPDNHLTLNDPRVSRAHAQIRAVRGQYIIFDLNSTGGTLVNGRRVHQCALKPGDVISLSGVPLIYGEDLPHDDTHSDGFTQSMNTSPASDPPEIIQ
jgi:pSer/pThr/pTyr-binding forkhead associated (FHA) protein